MSHRKEEYLRRLCEWDRYLLPSPLNPVYPEPGQDLLSAPHSSVMQDIMEIKEGHRRTKDEALVMMI